MAPAPEWVSYKQPPSQTEQDAELKDQEVMPVQQNWKDVEDDRKTNPSNIASWADLFLELSKCTIQIEDGIQQEISLTPCGGI